MSNAKLYWAPLETRFGDFAACVDDEGRLVRFLLRKSDAAVLDRIAERSEKMLAHVTLQVAEYCNGRRRRFDFEFAAEGTPFQHAVWDALVKIPFGETTSYGALAAKLNRPGSARAVGLANGSNPIGLIVPCHRVVGADGSLTGYGGGLPLKQALLAFEAEVCGYPRDLFAAAGGKRAQPRVRLSQ
jgi:methylated-DNA-[protein]-cysteine S-methyltransferase